MVEHQAGDGRVARGERTRRALAEALIASSRRATPIPRPGASPSAPGCRCGSCSTISTTSSRSCAPRWGSRKSGTGDTSDPSTPTLPVDERVARVVRQRAMVFQAVAPVRRSAELLSAQLAHRGGGARRGDASGSGPSSGPPSPPSSRADARPRPGCCSTRSRWRRRGRRGTNSSGSAAAAASCRRTMETLARAVLSGPPTGGRP